MRISVRKNIILVCLLFSATYAWSAENDEEKPTVFDLIFQTESFDNSLEEIFRLYPEDPIEKTLMRLDSLENTWIAFFDKARLSDVYNARCQAEGFNDRYISSTKNGLKAVKLAMESNELQRVPGLYINLGFNHEIIGNYTKSLEYYDLAFQFLKDHEHIQQSISQQARVLIYQARTLTKQEKYSRAEDYLQQALKLVDYENTPVEDMEIANRWEVIRAFLALSSIKERKEQFDECIAYGEITHDLMMIYLSDVLLECKGIKIYMAKVLMKDGQLSEAKKYFQGAMDIPESSDRISNKLKMSEVELLIARAEGRFNDAIEIQNQIEVFQAQFGKQKNERDIIRQQAAIEELEKLEQIKFKSAQRKHAVLRSQTLENNRTNLMVVSAFLIVVASGILFQRRAKERRKGLMLEISGLKNELLSKIVKDTVGIKNEILDRELIESTIDKKLNTSDWKIMNVIYSNPAVQISEIAEEVALSGNGVSSSLRKMYDLFEIETPQNKKMELAMKIAQIVTKNID
jgi:tetratricopeptide (TPR) repeat protein